MAFTALGKVIDSDKNPVPFAIVFKSDKDGKPTVPSKSTETGEKGDWKLDGLNDSDYVTIRMIGFKPYTFSAKSIPLVSIISANAKARFITTTLAPSESVSLGAVEIVSPKYVKPEIKPNYAKWFLIGGLIFIAASIYVASQKNGVKIKA